MNSIAWTLFAVNALALLVLPRKWAPVPLLVSCCYMTMGQAIHLGPFSMPVYRMILAVGFLRVLLRRERLAGRINVSDKLMAAWGIWVFVASLFHEWAPGSGHVFASGFIFNITLVYFLGRVWCQNLDDLTDVTRIIGLLLVPVALEMVFEHVGQRNLFSVFGGSVGQILRTAKDRLGADGFMIWCLGAGMFAHAGTSISVAYFDQSLIFFWLNMAALASMHAVLVRTSAAELPTRSAAPQIGSEAKGAVTTLKAGPNMRPRPRRVMPIAPPDLRSRMVRRT